MGVKSLGSTAVLATLFIKVGLATVSCFVRDGGTAFLRLQFRSGGSERPFPEAALRSKSEDSSLFPLPTDGLSASILCR